MTAGNQQKQGRKILKSRSTVKNWLFFNTMSDIAYEDYVFEHFFVICIHHIARIFYKTIVNLIRCNGI